MRYDPPLAVPIGAWVLVVAAAAIAYRFARSRASRDDTDYVIDLKAGTFTFVRGLGASDTGWWNLRRKHPYTPFVVPLASICGVGVEKFCAEKESARHLVWLIVQRKRANLGERVHVLGDWRSERDAVAFATWLRETLGLPRV